MPDTVEKVAERLARLEHTVAEGFYANDARINALDNKIDISVESLRSDIKTVLEAVGALTEELRRTTDAIRKEHAADRAILKLTLQDHGRRIESVENRVTSSSGQ